MGKEKTANKDGWHYRNLFGRIIGASVLCMFLVFLLLQPFGAAHAAAPYPASDVLGKLDQNGAPDLNADSINGVGLFSPSAAALDSVHHRLFVTSVNRILVFVLDSSDHLTSHTAASVLGQPNLSANICSNGPATSSSTLCQLSHGGISYDAADNYLFVAESQNNRVLVFDLSAGLSNGMNASYVLGQTSFSGTGSGLTQSAMSNPSGLSYDTANKRLFVSDSGNSRVLVYDLSSGITNGMNASSVLGQPDFLTSSCFTTQSKLCGPFAATWDATNQRLFVGDSSNNRVIVYDLSSGITNGMNASFVLGRTDFTSGNGDSSVTQHNTPDPEAIVYDSVQSRLFVSSGTANRATVFDLSSGITNGMNASSVLGQADFTSSSCAVSQNGMCTGFSASSNLAYDPVGKTLFFGDAGNNRVLVYDLSSGITNGMNASDVLGQVDPSGTPVFTTNASNNKNPYATNASYTQGSALDTVHHRLFVADCFFHRVAEYDLNTDDSIASHTMAHVLGQPGFTSSDAAVTQSGIGCASGAAYDAANDRLYVADYTYNRVLVYDLGAGITDGMNASFVLGQPDFTSSGSAAAQNELSSPNGLAYDPATHQVYVADSGNVRVVVYDTANLSNGMNASFVLGQPDFTSSTGNITQAGMSYPYGLALDSVRHQLFVGDWGSAGRVLIYDTSALSNGMNASNVLGEADFTSSNSASDTGGIDDKSFAPAGLAYDSNQQRLLVSDDNANRIMLFNLAGGIVNNMPASGVLGQPDLTTRNTSSSASATSLNDPEGINGVYDTVHNRLYTADSGNGRLLAFTFADLKPADSLAAASAGTSYNSGVLGSQTQGAATYAITNGSLPAGLSLDTSTGVISGTPQQVGTANFSIKLSDDNGAAGTFTDTVSYTLAVSSSGNTGGGTSGSGSGTSGSTITGIGTSAQTGSSGGESSSGGTVVSTYQPQVRFLNSFSSFFSAQGQTFDDLHPGDTLQLCLTPDANTDTSLANGTCSDKSMLYTITLTSIDVPNQVAHFTLSTNSQAIAVQVGQTSQIDVNQDHINDLSIGLNSIDASANTVSATFKYLTANQPALSAGSSTTPTTTTSSKRSTALWWGIAVAIVVLIAIAVAIRSWRHRHAK